MIYPRSLEVTRSPEHAGEWIVYAMLVDASHGERRELGGTIPDSFAGKGPAVSHAVRLAAQYRVPVNVAR